MPPAGVLASPSAGSNRLRSPPSPRLALVAGIGDDPGSSIVLLHTSEALLLDVRDLAERDRIVTFLTRERGKKSGVARGARARHSRFAGQLQPLGKAQITWFEKPGRDLVRISAVELVRPVHRLQADLEGILLGSYLADHMLEFAQEDESSELLFRLLDSTLEALLAGVDQDVAARYFECWVLRLGGIFPAPDACPRCATPLAARAVLPPHGETLLCPACARGAVAAGLEDVQLSDGGERPPRPQRPQRPQAGDRAGRVVRDGRTPGMIVGAETLEFLRRIGRCTLPQAGRPAPAGRTLRQVEELCARVRRHFLQHELRSYEVIQRTRAAL
jgi:DNA repair protein RecO (recombination protein O)